MESLRTNPNLALMTNINDLQSLNWYGDTPENMQAFMQMWNHIFANLNTTIADQAKQDKFFEVIKVSKILKEDIAHYERHDQGHADRTYDFLERAITRSIDKQLTAKNVADRDRLMKAGMQHGFSLDGGKLAVTVKGKRQKSRARSKAKKLLATTASPQPKAAAKVKAQPLAAVELKKKTIPEKVWEAKKSIPPLEFGHRLANACLYAQYGSCTNANCTRDHTILSKEDKYLLPLPNAGARARSQSKSEEKTIAYGEKGKGKGKGKGKDKGKRSESRGKGFPYGIKYCKTFAKTQACPNELLDGGKKCKWGDHLTENQVKTKIGQAKAAGTPEFS